MTGSDFPERYKDEIPRWYKQPEYIEIWVEKKAMRGVFAAIIKDGDRQVRIAPNGGWSSRSFSEENRKRLLKKRRREGKDVYVLYYGDYDPSGLRMVQKLKEELTGIGVHFEHVAITKEQIRQFHLEHLKNLDLAVKAKLGRDSNAKYFRYINNGELFQIEVDALDALGPDDLKRLLLDNIDEYFDEEIRERVLSDPKHQSKNIRRLVHRRLAEAKVNG
jgi:5S rRNA maturation endonuclease (ribonuclease M5)